MGGDVETVGELTMGTTVFDRRPMPAWRSNMDVAVDMDVHKVIQRIIDGLTNAAKQR